MRIVCPGCGAPPRIEPARSGADATRIKCSKCSTIFVVNLRQREKIPSDSSSQTPSPSAVLIVDDARFFREMLVDILKPLELRVLTVAGGIEALEIVRSERPALVILDLNLPEMDGFELIRRFRCETSPGTLRLLAMSAVYRTDSDISDAQQAGADAFLSKSFRPEHLLKEVRLLLQEW